VATEAVVSAAVRGLGSVKAVVEAATELAHGLQAAKQSSKKLRLAGMNASFTVQGLGERAAAFSAANRALIELAQDSAAGASAIEAIAARLHQSAGRLGTGQESLVAQVRGLTAASEQRSSEALKAFTATVTSLSTRLSEVSLDTEHVAAAARTVMMVIQQQDILRQGVEHVALVLRAMDQEFAQLVEQRAAAPQVIAYLGFQERAGLFAAQLLERLRGELDSLLNLVLAPLEQARLAAQDVVERLGDPHETESRMTAPSEVLVNGFFELPALSNELEGSETELAALETDVMALRPSLRTIEGVPTHINLVSVLMKIETSRGAELTRAAIIADDLRGASDSFRVLHERAEQAVGALHTQLADVRVELSRQRAGWTTLRSRPSILEVSATGMRALAAGFALQLGELKDACVALVVMVEALREGLAGFGGAVELTSQVREACVEHRLQAERARAKLLALGHQPAEDSTALSELIEHFTILEHKQMADGGRAQANDSQAGELTLF
jgi:hypothetical protein